MKKLQVLNIKSVCLYFWLSYPANKVHLFCVVFYRNMGTCLPLQCFPHNLFNGTIFRINLLKNNVVGFGLQILSAAFLIRSVQRKTVVNVNRLSCTVHISPFRFERNLKFLDRFSKNAPITNFIRISSGATELFHGDGQKDRQAWRS